MDYTGVGIKIVLSPINPNKPESVDIYIVLLTDDSKYAFTVYNGNNGEISTEYDGVPQI